MLRWVKKFLSKSSAREPRRDAAGIEIPAGSFDKIYAIGDIHGRLDLLQEAEHKIEADIAQHECALAVYLGDYVDRGPDSAGVLDRLRERQAPRFERLCLRGNHDDVFLSFLDRPLEEWGWLDMGGRETLRSYGLALDPARDRRLGDEVLLDLLRTHVPQSHRDFIAQTPLWAQRDDLLFVHAGIKPGVPIEEQDPMDFMWIREPFLTEGPALPLTVIHGHTPQTTVTYGRNRVGIDTGAYATGRLSVLKIAEGSMQEL